jgi:hypothetical protein
MKYLISSCAFMLIVSSVLAGGVITSFTGGDAGEGLTFTGTYVYAVNIGGSAEYPPVVQGITFVNDSLTPGVNVALSGEESSKGDCWGTKPEYGGTGNDNWLEAMMHATALSYGIDPLVEVAMDVTAGRRYEMQFLISENVITNDSWIRHFDIAVEGVTLVDEFTPLPLEAIWTNAPHTGYAIMYQFTARDNVANVSFTRGSTIGDQNPVVQAFTLKDISPVLRNPDGTP